MSNKSYLFDGIIFEFTPEDYHKDFNEQRDYWAKMYNDCSEHNHHFLYNIQKWNVISLVINDPYLLRLK